MPLQKLEDLSYESFSKRLGSSIEILIQVFESSKMGGWRGTLLRYDYDGMGYREGVEVRKHFHNQYAHISSSVELIDWAENILSWGKMKSLSPKMRKGLGNSLEILEAEDTTRYASLCVERIASISKIYEMSDPSKWVIFDSYCARGLQWIIREYWETIQEQQYAGILKIPWPAGRTSSPINGFSHLGSPRQSLLGFLYSSWLCRLLAEHLNKRKGEFRWETFHVEMAAFQLGHEV